MLTMWSSSESILTQFIFNDNINADRRVYYGQFFQYWHLGFGTEKSKVI